MVMKNTLDSILEIYWETNFVGIFRENTNSPSAFCKADTRKLRSNIFLSNSHCIKWLFDWGNMNVLLFHSK